MVVVVVVAVAVVVVVVVVVVVLVVVVMLVLVLVMVVVEVAVVVVLVLVLVVAWVTVVVFHLFGRFCWCDKSMNCDGVVVVDFPCLASYCFLVCCTLYMKTYVAYSRATLASAPLWP